MSAIDRIWEHTIYAEVCEKGFNCLEFRKRDDGTHSLKKIIKIKNIHGKDEFKKAEFIEQAEKRNRLKYQFKKNTNIDESNEIYEKLCEEDPNTLSDPPFYKGNGKKNNSHRKRWFLK